MSRIELYHRNLKNNCHVRVLELMGKRTFKTHALIKLIAIVLEITL